VVSQIAGTVALVVAFIPVVGQALAGVLLIVAAVAAITSALGNIALAATGKRTWAQAGVAVAGAALSVIGLGTAARAATVLSKAAFKAGARESLAGLRTAPGGLGELGKLGKEPFCKVGFGTCFVAGTLVRTPDGDRPIQDLRAGDSVYTFDQTTRTERVETVEETFARATTTLHHLTIDGHTVTTTAEHPFMVHGMGWVQAAELEVGDHLSTGRDSTAAGHATLDAVDIEQVDEVDAVPVYNVHVLTHHTYYVLAGEIPVLVHNMAGHEVTPGLERERSSAAPVEPVWPTGPAGDDVWHVLDHVDMNGAAPRGYKGGRTFRNADGDLPQVPGVSYREWDVTPYVKGVNRGASRLLTGSDGSAYVTRDHYQTFVIVRRGA